MGADKAILDWGGARAVDRVASAAAQVGAAPILTVGGRELGFQHLTETERGGPVAAITAGARALRLAGRLRALVLAVDAPTLSADDLVPLLVVEGPGAAYAGLHLPLVVALDALPPGAGAGWSMARLITDMGLRLLDPDPEAVLRLRGANTPAERAALLASLPAWKWDARPEE